MSESKGRTRFLAATGTENVYKLYAESLQSQAHLEAIVEQAQRIVAAALQRPVG